MTWMNTVVKTLGIIMLLPLILKNYSPNDIVVWYLFASLLTLGIIVDAGFQSNFIRFVGYVKGGANL